MICDVILITRDHAKRPGKRCEEEAIFEREGHNVCWVHLNAKRVLEFHKEKAQNVERASLSQIVNLPKT